MNKRFLFSILLLLTVSSFAQVEVSTRLMRALQNSSPTDFVRGFVYLRDQVDILALDEQLYAENASLEKRAYEVITALQNKAQNTQGNLKVYLEEKSASRDLFRYESYWIANMILIEAKASVFYDLMNNMEVEQMDLDAELRLDKPEIVQHNVENVESVEPGLKIINADKLWQLGITGQGRLVMGVDTGVEVSHPALNHKWRGNSVPANQAWFDPAGSTTPNDCDGHGTHTVGTMTGRSTTTADTVGVAPDAQWIAAKTICSSPHTSNSVAAFQWALNPDGNPSTITDMPDAIGNSWYDPDVTNECSGIWKTTLDAMEAAGVAIVFSAGNSGPGTSTITKPKNINTDEVNAFAVANIVGSTYLGGSNDPIASSSSRGPSACGGSGSLLIKPEVAAPGTSVRSSYTGGGYSSLTGTSMACPHVVGAIALLKSFAPTLTGKQIKLALYNTAKDLGAVGEDNNYGRGLIDVYAAFLSLGTPDTTPPTTVTNLAVVQPQSNALKLSWTVPSDTSNGGVVGYKIKMSTSPIPDTTAFNAATEVMFNGAPGAAGTTDMVDVKNLTHATTYYFSIRARDLWGNWSALSNNASGVTLAAPVMTATPDSIYRVLNPAQVVLDSIILSNTSSSPSTLNYTISLENNTFPGGVDVSVVPGRMLDVEGKPNLKFADYEFGPGISIEGQGGPDAFGYKWIDSDEPNGPVYEWNDIAATGTEVTNWVATGTFGARDEGHSGSISLPFGFKFYGQVKNAVFISSNGAILFSAPTSNIFTNAAIPTAAAPNEYIAPFWDDLDGTSGGNVYTKAEGNKFTIQFNNWPRYNTSGSALTFQVVLYQNGRIMYYYKTMTSTTLNSATVGIENGTGTIGLQTAYNAVYVKNNHAVKYAADPEWLNSNHFSGTLNQGSSASIRLELRAEDYNPGIYSMDVKISGNDPSRPVKVIPVRMMISGEVPVELTSFNAAAEGNSAVLQWVTATEVNNKGFIVERKSDGSTWTQVALIAGKGNSTETSVYNFTEKGLTVGKHSYRLTQEDFDGTKKTFNEVQVDITRPNEFTLGQNYPNPFNPSTAFTFSIPERARVMLSVYSSLGELVAVVVNEDKDAGYYQYQFDASSLPSGTYIYTLSASYGGKTYKESKKMTLIK